MQRVIEEETPWTIVPPLAYNNDVIAVPNRGRYWGLVKSIVKAAAQCQRTNADETSWHKVVRTVLVGLFEDGIGMDNSIIGEGGIKPHIYGVQET